ncbi:protein phosphatase 2A regulatory subunit [Heterostelium album PN500]|uniref:Serine/threonine protein phosphatase 2A regulatory subunit n=1 Tax=Heterostelium pallidum (strain ATCC 26659 / Pp 5 / PN500) TaxID=670386 RepID=D3BNT9_HETP5|nr:protein phosphatase 2A regulatory subunit [Heterostelium album PN500]EFA76858.1 protein phosphatase 2A regulatory subunit [Heterostelium album PN500]|eukprot:XP_020428990.1 protein phosphatase 2A regulatory subunit [Heterostelium album PN500]
MKSPKESASGVAGSPTSPSGKGISLTPKSEIPIKNTINLRRSASSRFHEKSSSELQQIPAFNVVPPEERPNLLLLKLKQCCALFDFSDSEADSKSKSIKREALLQCVDYLSSSKDAYTEAVYEALFEMISINLFRPLPPRMNPYGVMYDPEEDEPILEPAWLHIQIVYEILLRFIDSPIFNTHIAKAFVDQKFVLQLLDLFDSEDPRERDYLKTTLHRIYGKFIALRGFIRTAIKDLFCTFVYESYQHNGVSEILEVLGSIINGFAVPLKDEHKQFLVKVLLPLHKPKSYSVYCSHLGYCITQFIEKDPTLSDVVFKTVLRMWPVGNSQKEVLFLYEIEDLLNSIGEEQFMRIYIPLFKQITKCFNSEHFQVAERALLLWSNDHVVSLVSSKTCLPNVLYENSNNHWNKSIRSLSFSSLKLFMDIDVETFNRISDQYKERKTNKITEEKKPQQPRPITSNISALPENGEKPISMIRRKSLLPVDPSTIAALSNHRSLEGLVHSGDGDHDAEETEMLYDSSESKVPVAISQ